jgi:hypothetical protein
VNRTYEDVINKQSYSTASKRVLKPKKDQTITKELLKLDDNIEDDIL